MSNILSIFIIQTVNKGLKYIVRQGTSTNMTDYLQIATLKEKLMVKKSYNTEYSLNWVILIKIGYYDI